MEVSGLQGRWHSREITFGSHRFNPHMNVPIFNHFDLQNGDLCLWVRLETVVKAVALDQLTKGWMSAYKRQGPLTSLAFSTVKMLGRWGATKKGHQEDTVGVRVGQYETRKICYPGSQGKTIGQERGSEHRSLMPLRGQGEWELTNDPWM